MSDETIDRAPIVALIRRMETEAIEADLLADVYGRGESFRAGAVQEGRAEALREIMFQLKPLCGIGKLE